MINIQKNPILARQLMHKSLDLIKLDMLSEYEETGLVNISEWVNKYPTHRFELLDFWVWLKGTPSEETSPSDFEAVLKAEDIDSYKDSLRDACLAVTLGAAMLVQEVVPKKLQLETLGMDLEACRAASRVWGSGQAFRKAVVYTWVVSRLEEKRPRVTRLAAQKVSYLLEQAMCLRIFVDHDRKPMGPYDHKIRYRDAEPLAQRKRWLEIDGTVLKTGDELGEVTKYVSAYLRSASLAARFVSHLSCRSDEELETLATVHWTCHELSDLGKVVTIDTVRSALASSDDWRSKLEKPHFNQHRIADALRLLTILRLIRSRE